MARREKSKQACSIDRLKEDWISQLPDPLICQILSHLPIKDIVTISILSTRWTSLWLWVPRLELEYEDFPNLDAYKSFGDRFFDSNRASCIEKVKFSIEDIRFGDSENDALSYLTSWIDAAVKHKIQHLHVCCPPDFWYKIPLRLYTCETLVSLKLFEVVLDDVEFVSLPFLRSMRLKYIRYREETIFERLIGCCPVLEKLKIIVGYSFGEIKSFRVLSRSLKKLIIKLEEYDEVVGFGFVIDAPRLRFWSIDDKSSSFSFLIFDMASNVKVDISLPHGLDDINEASFSLRKSNIHSFLPGISKVRDLTICRDIFKLICQYSKTEPMPQFGYMSRLCVTLLVSDLNWLPTFLESCPNLKSLILVWNSNSTMYSEELSRFNLSSVPPECFLSSLEFVDIKTSISGLPAELKLVRFCCLRKKKIAGREKSKQAGSKDRLKEDRISQLPDPLICEILSHLPLKDIVRTSVLSTRWTSLWLWVPRLELRCGNFRNFDDLISFGDRFFDSNRASCIDKVEFTVEEATFGIEDTRFVDDEYSYLTSWIDAAVKRKIQHLHVSCNSYFWYDMPLRLYTCETLVSLKLYQVILDDVEFVSLPCLKTMHLDYTMWYGKTAIYERFIGCCPVLEKLKIVVGCVYCEVKVLRVLSRSLKKLIIKLENEKDVGLGFVIDAPRLRFFSINDELSHLCVIDDMVTSAKVDISLPHGLDDINEASISLRRSNIHCSLPGISKVRDLTICSDIFKQICQYSKKVPLPQFGYMSRLRVTLLVSDLNWLPTFLESCPNLKSLILVWENNCKKMYFEELRRFNFSCVPECLVSSIEFVDIKTTMSGHFSELKLVSYILANSTILKKLTLHLNRYCTNEKYIVREILSIPRRSITCKVVICKDLRELVKL